MKSASIFFLGMLLVLPGVFSQAVDTLTIESVIDIALRDNFQLKSARNNTRIAKNNNSLGNAGFLPTLDLNGSWVNNIQDTEQQFANNDTLRIINGAKTEVLSGSADLNWTLFDGTRMFVARDRLESQESLALSQMKIEVDNTLSLVISQFYVLALEQERVALFESNIAFSQNRVDIVRQKYDVGKESKLALLQAQVDLNADRSAYVRQQELAQTQKLRLMQTLSMQDVQDFEVRYQLRMDTTMQLNTLLNKAQSLNPNLQSALLNQKILRQQRDEIDRAKYPVIDLNLGYRYSNLESEAGFLIRNQTNGLNYGFTARFNVFDGFNRVREIQNAEILMENADLVYYDLENQIVTAVRTTFNTYQNNLYLAKIEKENLDVAEENSTIALERFRLGASDALELREAQVNAVNAQVRALEAAFQAKQAEIQLLTLSGQISTLSE